MIHLIQFRELKELGTGQCKKKTTNKTLRHMLSGANKDNSNYLIVQLKFCSKNF